MANHMFCETKLAPPGFWKIKKLPLFSQIKCTPLTSTTEAVGANKRGGGQRWRGLVPPLHLQLVASGQGVLRQDEVQRPRKHLSGGGTPHVGPVRPKRPHRRHRQGRGGGEGRDRTVNRGGVRAKAEGRHWLPDRGTDTPHVHNTGWLTEGRE